MRKLVVLFLALLLGTGSNAFAQDVAKMFEELKVLVQKNTDEIQNLKKQLAAKDRVIADQESKIKNLEGQSQRIDSIDQRIESLIEVEKVAPAAAPRGEFGLLMGSQSSVYAHPGDFMMGGFYDPVIVAKDPLGNRLAGEIMATFCREDRRMTVEPELGWVYNALLVNPNYMSRQDGVNVDLDTLSVILGAKYRIETLGRIKPYMAGGLGMYVFAMDLDSDFTVGQVPPAEELRRRGYPAGNADLEWGVNFGGGVEYQITDLIAVGFDSRMNWNTGGHKTDFGTFAGFVSFNF